MHDDGMRWKWFAFKVDQIFYNEKETQFNYNTFLYGFAILLLTFRIKACLLCMFRVSTFNKFQEHIAI